MGTVIGIMGESGHGKTSSLRTLDPKTTYLFDADKKGLPWRGWRNQYSEEKKNYIRTSNSQTILSYIDAINKKATHIKTIAVDTMNGIMIDDEMARMKEKGFDKWKDLATSVYNIITRANELREDLNVILTFHSENIGDPDNYFTRILTSGQKLQKIKLETKLQIVLFARCRMNDSGKNNYFFETQSNRSTAKSPMGMFTQLEIPNNMKNVLKAVRDYETEPLPESKGDEFSPFEPKTKNDPFSETGPEAKNDDLPFDQKDVKSKDPKSVSFTEEYKIMIRGKEAHPKFYKKAVKTHGKPTTSEICKKIYEDIAKSINLSKKNKK